MKDARYPIVEVEWSDHAWARYRKDAKLIKRRTIGYLIKETPKAVRLAQSLQPPEEFMTIGRAMISEMRRLREPR